MSIIRKDLSNRDWTIFAVDRSKRPGDFKKLKENKVVREYEIFAAQLLSFIRIQLKSTHLKKMCC